MYAPLSAASFDNGPSALAARLNSRIRGSEEQTPMYLRRVGDGTLSMSGCYSASLVRQLRRTFYQRIPNFLFDCASGDANRILNLHSCALHHELHCRHPRPRYGLLDPTEPAPDLIGCSLLVGLHALRREDWMNLPGTEQAFRAAAEAVQQCAGFYDVAEETQKAADRAGCFKTDGFLNPETLNLAALNAQRAVVVRLDPAVRKDLGPFLGLAVRVHQHALKLINNLIAAQQESQLDRACRRVLGGLGLRSDESVAFCLHRLYERGEWILNSERQPEWIRALAAGLAEIEEQDTAEYRQLVAILQRMLKEAGQIDMRESAFNRIFYSALDSLLRNGVAQPWTLESLKSFSPANSTEVFSALGCALFADDKPSAPPQAETRLLCDNDLQRWSSSTDYRDRLVLMQEILTRPKVEGQSLGDPSTLPLPCYGSWRDEDRALVQDHIMAGLFIHRLEQKGARIQLLDAFWNAKRQQARLSRLIWSVLDQAEFTDELETVRHALGDLERLLAGRHEPVFESLRDELLCCIGELAQRMDGYREARE